MLKNDARKRNFFTTGYLTLLLTHQTLSVAG